ncbi:hypothetical protein MKEN_00539500 [Mycena kentingensis (nom. inval.)]|nr:hypothetical protein MKEN_00539500 [Mycena kentingensis (nom. inval.)]
MHALCSQSHVVVTVRPTDIFSLKDGGLTEWTRHTQAFSNFVVRGIFARRVYRLSKGNIWGTALIVALSTVDLACGLGAVISVKAFRIATFPELSSISTLFYVNFASGTAADIAVALALCYMLYTSRTGFERCRTDSLIRVLMTYTINTGLLVALDAAAGMLTYAFMPDNFWFLGCYLLLGKLYLNSYLAILNARKILRGDGMTSINLSQLSGVRWRTGGPGSGHGHGAEHVFEEEESRTQQGTGLGSQPLAISKMVDVQREEYADDDRQSRPEASRRLSDVEKEAWNPDEKPFR